MGFAPGAGGSVLLQLDADEQQLLTDLLYSVLELLADQDAAADPVVQRWFPDAYRDAPAAAAEFRRSRGSELTQRKRATAVAALESLDRPAEDGVRTLSPDVALDWLAALNDIRLALGTRLDLTGEDRTDPDDLAEDDPQRPALALYDWLTWLQETLVRSMP